MNIHYNCIHFFLMTTVSSRYFHCRKGKLLSICVTIFEEYTESKREQMVTGYKWLHWENKLNFLEEIICNLRAQTMNVMEQFINYFLSLQLSYWIIFWLCLCSFVSLFSVAGDGGSRRLPDVEKLAAEEPEKHELWQSSLPEDHRRRPQHRHHPAQRQCGTHLSCGELTTKAPLCTEQHGQDVLIPEPLHSTSNNYY